MNCDIHGVVQKRARDEDATDLITMAKLVCGRVVRRVADEWIQFHGGDGDMKESMVGRALVESRPVRYVGGRGDRMLR